MTEVIDIAPFDIPEPDWDARARRATMASRRTSMGPLFDYPSDDDDQPPELPAYERRTSTIVSRVRSSVQHQFSLKGPKDKPWLTLRMKSWARSSKSVPLYLEGQKISGIVELDLDKPENIQGVSIRIRGLILIAGIDSRAFFDWKQDLWEPARGDPRNTDTDSDTGPFTGKLQGNYHWGFSTVLPTETTIESKLAKEWGMPETVPLPPTFSEKGSHSFLDYEFSVNIKRAGVFRPSSRLSTHFNYIPKTKPDAPSALRKMSYQEDIPLLGPRLDPEGWKSSPMCELQGTLFGAIDVKVNCSLSLASPLAYTRGSVIPCVLTIECEDPQALSFLSMPAHPVVQLRRKVNTTVGSGALGNAWVDDTTDARGGSIQLATWWRPQESIGNDHKTKTLHGEIPLPKDLKPSFTFGEFYLKYYVVLAGFKAVGWVAAEKRKLFRAGVTITTDFAEGPRPRSYAPPPPIAGQGGANATDYDEMLRRVFPNISLD